VKHPLGQLAQDLKDAGFHVELKQLPPGGSETHLFTVALVPGGPRMPVWAVADYMKPALEDLPLLIATIAKDRPVQMAVFQARLEGRLP
jgi:hypothetical protein